MSRRDRKAIDKEVVQALTVLKQPEMAIASQREMAPSSQNVGKRVKPASSNVGRDKRNGSTTQTIEQSDAASVTDVKQKNKDPVNVCQKLNNFA
jgi:hypothetical protein